MFLTRRSTVAAALAAVPFLLSACGIRMDDAYWSRRKPPVCASETPETADSSVENAIAPETPGKGSFLPKFRLDPRPDRSRGARAERLSRDPYLQPTPREQRQARAMVQAQEQLMKQGGPLIYRNDGAASDPGKVKYAFAQGALTIDYKTEADLNSLDGEPRALSLTIYHLSNRNAIDRFADSENGMERLLDGERFDTSVIDVERFFLQPGSAGRLTLDRQQDGRYVALAAGYNQAEKTKCLFVGEYGMGRWKATGKTAWSNKVWMHSPLPLNIEVSFDNDRMRARDAGRIYGDMKGVTNVVWERSQ